MGEERAAKRIKTQDGASSSAASGSTYEVFLSFRGADIRLSFTDHLYGSLRGAGIRTFRDNEELRVGEEIGPDLMKAIEESSISLPIFSKGYASSKWCLREVTHMVKCMNDKDPEERRRHIVCPIFYDVTPLDVKHQAGSFEQAFEKHTTDVDACTVTEWKDALKEVCELKGWERDKIADGHEAELIKKIVTKVCQMLKTGHVILTDKLVGMDYHVDEMTKLMDRDSGNGVQIIGIVGMGGIGKTTIAKFMYNKRCGQFRNQCSFLEDVRERVKCNGYAGVRKQLISDGITIERSAYKTVLIVLDDVEKRSQLTGIIGGRAHFGSGSRIIVTTRNKDVFVKEEGDLIYEPGEMNYDDSLLLFCKHAFKSTQPREGFEDISREVVQKADGLPLFLVVIGSMLFNKKGIKYWKGTLDKLKEIPAKDVQNRLKISYDALDNGQKQIFLDIACHFIGEDQTLPFYMWKDCEFHPDCEIDNLVYLSLITIGEDNVFRMHDQLRDLGRYIVNQENPDASEERSRLWSHEEAVDTLNNQSGTNKIQTLHIKNYYDSYCFSNHDFKGMSKLRYLHLRGDSNIEGDFKGLLPELRWFSWGRYSDSPVAVTNFCPRKLVILDLSYNNKIGDDWESSILIKEARNLKVLDISHCNLTKTPDFSTLSKLERLNLEGCQSLTKIGSSVNHLKSLTYFNAKSCSLLRKLPPEFGSMASLQEVHLDGHFALSAGIDELPESIGLLTQLRCLSLRGCTSVVKIPESIWNLKSLVELNISKTGITEISESVGMLNKLEVLNCSNCESLRREVPSRIGRLTSLRVLNLSQNKVDGLPEDIGSLCNLRELNLSSNERLTKLPKNVVSLSNLKKLNLSYSAVKKLPSVGIERLQNLEELDCFECRYLEGQLPEGIGRLSSLKVLNLSNTKVDKLPEDVGGLCNLSELDLSWNSQLKKLPGVGIERLQKLEELDCSECWSLKGQLPEGIGRLSSLKVLNLSNTKVDKLPEDVGGLCNLSELDLSRTAVKKLPELGIERLQNLKVLNCYACRYLEGQLPEGIGRLSSLKVLNLSNTKVDKLPEDVGGLCNLSELDLSRTAVKKLPELGIERLQNLKVLNCYACRYLEGQLPEGIGRLSSLKVLNLSNTKVDKLPEDVGGLCNLSELDLSWNSQLKKLPGVGIERLQKLEELDCFECWSLKGQLPAGIWCLSNLRVLDLSHTKITGGIPKDISGLSNLQSLDLGFCVKLQLPVEGLELPLSLTKLAIPLTGASLNGVRSLVNLRSLKFHKNFEPVKEEMVGIDMPSNLKKLKLRGLYDQVMCRRLLPAMKFDRSSRLRQLHISSCTFETFPLDLSNCQKLRKLSIEDCPATREIKGLEVLTSLKYLTVYGCPLLEKDDLHPDLLKSESLRIDWSEGPSREMYSESDTHD